MLVLVVTDDSYFVCTHTAHSIAGNVRFCFPPLSALVNYDKPLQQTFNLTELGNPS